jgi:hypothetical protein
LGFSACGRAGGDRGVRGGGDRGDRGGGWGFRQAGIAAIGAAGRWLGFSACEVDGGGSLQFGHNSCRDISHRERHESCDRRRALPLPLALPFQVP